MNLLFLCTGNSCRSVMAEATLNHLAADHHAMSAGSRPTGAVNPRALALLEREGIPTEGLASKGWDDLPTPDLVVTVCGNAAQETCPLYLSNVPQVHWGVDDPAAATGTDDEIDAAFQDAYVKLRACIEAFLALPAEVQADRERLQRELELIGHLHTHAGSTGAPPGTHCEWCGAPDFPE